MAAKVATSAALSKAAAAGADQPLAPAQTSVVLVQVELLDADDAIRAELKKRGFRVTHQALVHLSAEDARRFVLDVCNPASALYQVQDALLAANDTNAGAEATGATLTARATTPSALTSAAPTPRDKIATPRSPRTVGGVTSAAELNEDAIRGLSAGPVLLLAVDKPGAVAELLELIGPPTSELWAAAPASLRARFGKAGVRCSAHESTAPHELAFLLQHTNVRDHHHHGNNSNSDKHKRSTDVAKDADVDLVQLLDFLFPPHVLHPNSTGRLFVFGLYGPLDGSAHLRAGERGLHVVTDRELDTMSSRMEREDILAVYDMCSLSQEQEEEVLRTVNHALKSVPRYSRRDVAALFAPLPRNSRGRLSFHDMQAAIMKERCRRVLCMKERVHPALAAPIQNQFRQTITRIVKTKDEIAPATMFLKDLGFTGAENATLVSRLLSNHAFQICHLDDGNAPSLTQNVRLLRDHVRVPGDLRAPWNPNCVTRK